MDRLHLFLFLLALDHSLGNATCMENPHIQYIRAWLIAHGTARRVGLFVHVKFAVSFWNPDWLLISSASFFNADPLKIESWGNYSPIWSLGVKLNQNGLVQAIKFDGWPSPSPEP